MKIIKFEDIESWKEARTLVNTVYSFTAKRLFNKDFGLKDQIQRASVSCMSNIAEGFDGGSNQQFIQFLLYARRSSSEVQSLLYAALDREYISEKEFSRAYKQAENVGKLINGFVRYLRSNNKQNSQQDNRLTGRQIK